MKSDLIDIEARYIHDTERAWLLATEEEDEIWLPKASCEFDRETGTLTLPEALATEKGLI